MDKPVESYTDSARQTQTQTGNEMSLTYDLRGLDILNLPEWFAAHDYSDKHDNYTLFETLVFRMMVIRPSKDGTIRAAEAKTLIIRNRVWEAAEGGTGVLIPDEFIRRMIGLSTNVFPAYSDKEFDQQMGRIAREAIQMDMPKGWDNF